MKKANNQRASVLNLGNETNDDSCYAAIKLTRDEFFYYKRKTKRKQERSEIPEGTCTYTQT